MEFGQTLLKPAYVYTHASITKTPKYLIIWFSYYPFLFFTQRFVLSKNYIPLD